MNITGEKSFLIYYPVTWMYNFVIFRRLKKNAV